MAALKAFDKRRNFDRIWVEDTGFDPGRGVELTQRLLTESQPPTAFIYETDTMAAASLRALSSIMLTSDMLSWDSGIRRFPYDLPAIVSFEDSAICESAFPPSRRCIAMPACTAPRSPICCSRCWRGSPWPATGRS